MWQMFASAAIDGLGAALGGRAARHQIKIANILGEAKARAGNMVREASNINTAAQSSLQRWVQSTNNKAALKRGGESLEALTVNFARNTDAWAKAGFSQKIRAAEAIGGARASQAAAGAGGSTADMINITTALRDSIVDEDSRHMKDAASYDFSRRYKGVFSQMVSSLDNSLVFTNLDYGKDLFFKQREGSFNEDFWKGTAKSLVSQVMPNVSSAFSSLFSSNAAKPPATTFANQFGFSQPPSPLTIGSVEDSGANIGDPYSRMLEGVSFGQ